MEKRKSLRENRKYSYCVGPLAVYSECQAAAGEIGNKREGNLKKDSNGNELYGNYNRSSFPTRIPDNAQSPHQEPARVN